MITRIEAEEIAARWARGEAEQRGYGCEPALAEFDLGWVIWTRPAPDVLPLPGDGARTVIDRETGTLSTWPAIPADEIAELYRQRRPKPSATVDPWRTLRRASRRRPSPTTVAELIVAGRLFRAQGAKGDQEINHHPLVAAGLGAIPAAARVRGAERHAELIAVSDALHEQAQASKGGRLSAFLVRDQGDPDAGAPIRPCETCLTVLVGLGCSRRRSWRSRPGGTTASTARPAVSRPRCPACWPAAAGWASSCRSPRRSRGPSR
ncbi:YwqJ-related putative deaminase [Paractinoplanes durhamensis]|uniref:YwqJ-related putative deaminase n=1 Tax=Paractinoplanes durhamensis TaxID=113563 RepID=UPI00364238DE